MRRIGKYSDQFDEFFHPFWLGLIMLFTIIMVIGMLCLIRKKCGSRLRYLFNRLCGRNELNDERHLKSNKYLSVTNRYNWPPAYTPPSNFSPKFYKLVRTIRTISTDSDSSSQHIEINENNPINHDVFSY